MELGKQIKKYRNEQYLSQEQLAEKIYVSRQTISNWENDKSYPDVNSLVLLSEVFATSIDNLIKGDVELMKNEIKQEDRVAFNKLGKIYTILFILIIVTPIPLIHYLWIVGIVIWVLLLIVAMVVAFKVEKEKKRLDIQTYREIVAFSEGIGLDEIAKAREEGKRPYQKVLLAVAAGVITLLVAILFILLL